MSELDHTEDEYLDMLRAHMAEPDSPIERVASLEEWARFKKALDRWAEEQEAGWDQAALLNEYEDAEDE